MKVAYLGCSGNTSKVMGKIDTEGMAAHKECDIEPAGDQSITLQGNPGKQCTVYASELSLPEVEGTGLFFIPTSFDH